MSYGRDQEVKLLRQIINKLDRQDSEFPYEYDKKRVTTTDATSGDPTTIIYSKSDVDLFTHVLTYDASGNFESLTVIKLI